MSGTYHVAKVGYRRHLFHTVASRVVSRFPYIATVSLYPYISGIMLGERHH